MKRVVSPSRPEAYPGRSNVVAMPHFPDVCPACGAPAGPSVKFNLTWNLGRDFTHIHYAETSIFVPYCSQHFQAMKQAGEGKNAREALLCYLPVFLGLVAFGFLCWLWYYAAIPVGLVFAGIAFIGWIYSGSETNRQMKGLWPFSIEYDREGTLKFICQRDDYADRLCRLNGNCRIPEEKDTRSYVATVQMEPVFPDLPLGRHPKSTSKTDNRTSNSGNSASL